jgi:hypothetical protein
MHSSSARDPVISLYCFATWLFEQTDSDKFEHVLVREHVSLTVSVGLVEGQVDSSSSEFVNCFTITNLVVLGNRSYHLQITVFNKYLQQCPVSLWMSFRTT